MGTFIPPSPRRWCSGSSGDLWGGPSSRRRCRRACSASCSPVCSSSLPSRWCSARRGFALSEAPPPGDRENADESDRMHAQVGWVLRIGLTLAVLLLASGLVVLLAGRENDAPAARLWHLDGGLGPALTTLGVMVLAFTPA